MTRRADSRGAWLRMVARLGGLAVLLCGGPGWAQEIRAGVWEAGLALGYSRTFQTNDAVGVDSVDGLHLLPRLGYVITEPAGPGWLRGSFQLLAEPTLIRLDGEPTSSTVVGLATLGRWILAGGERIKPYLEVGVGILGGETRFRQTNCDVNFTLQGGVGLHVFVSPAVAVTAGYRLHHVSNANSCDQNLGLNSNLFLLGMSYYFR